MAAAVICVLDGALAEEYVVSLTTLVIVELCLLYVTTYFSVTSYRVGQKSDTFRTM